MTPGQKRYERRRFGNKVAFVCNAADYYLDEVPEHIGAFLKLNEGLSEPYNDDHLDMIRYIHYIWDTWFYKQGYRPKDNDPRMIETLNEALRLWPNAFPMKAEYYAGRENAEVPNQHLPSDK